MLLNRSILRTVTTSLRSYTTSATTAKQYTIPAVENNESTESNRLSKTLTKFWNKVNIQTTNEGTHEIQLDSKTVRTPLGHHLEIPSDRKLLAHMLLHEWTSISTSTVKTHALPLTSLASRVLDLKHADKQQDHEAMAKVGKREDIVEDLLRYLDTDTLLVFAPRSEYEGKLRAKQEELYRPVISNVEKILGDVELSWLDTEVGLRGNVQTEQVRDAARSYLLALNHWDLVALEKVTLSTKSLICAVMVLENKSKNSEHVMELEEIANCATLEVVFQTEKWGEVEDTHDVDYQDIRRNIASAAILAFKEDK